MTFWIYMFLSELICPITLIVFGLLFLKKPPRNIRSGFGYRTGMSMKNASTWRFAHEIIGRLWTILGAVMLPITIAAMLFFYGDSEDTVAKAGEIIIFVQVALMLIPAAFTEVALRKRFDKNGNVRR